MASQSHTDQCISTGQMRASDTWGDYNQLLFVVSQELAKLQTATLVRVVACTNSGGLSPVGFVDVVPMVSQINGAGIGTPHVTVFNIPYLRAQGGANAVIIDPEVGDIGMCAFASRDISKVKNTRAPAVPGSLRKYNFADGMYLGGMLNGTPTQYVQFSAAGIKMHSPVKITLDAPTVELVATNVAITSTTLKHNGVNIGATHTHISSAPGTPTSVPS